MDIYGKREMNTTIGQKCDTCGKSTLNGDYVPVRIEFSYGHDLDGASYDFCSNQCLLDFINAELKKEK
jgi:endogenous inhibitor of DNA gyrase (YacG/DUF329 family)